MFQSFSHESKSLFLQSSPKQFIWLLCEGIVNLVKRNLQSIKRHHLTNSIVLSRKHHLEAKKRRFGIRKSVSTPKSNYSSFPYPFVLICSSVFSSLLLCTTTSVQKLSQLQSRSFRSVKLNKVPRTKMICLERKKTKSCLPKKFL